MKKYYLPVRALHLYIGLFISPFVLIFALSVLVINHPQFLNRITPLKDQAELKIKLDSVPLRSTDLLTAKAILEKLDLKGEVDFINKNDSTIFFPVRTPGKSYKISANTQTGLVSVIKTDLGILRGTTFLHFMPGPHNAALRGNSGFIKVWRYITDSAVYFLLFLTLSGIFLWYFLRSERNLGIFAIAAGILIITGLILFTF